MTTGICWAPAYPGGPGRARRRCVGLRLVLCAVLVTVLTALAVPPVSAVSPAPTIASGCPPEIRTVLDTTPATYDRTVALTFDDGPSPRWTPQLLDLLARLGVRATFFVNGTNVDAHPWLARRIVAEGHAIGNHTYSHANLDELSPAMQVAEIERGSHAIEAATGVVPCLFRGPYGSHHGSSVRELVWERGMSIGGWSHNSRDYTTPLSPSPAFQVSIVGAVTAPVLPHPVLLLHDGSPGNYRQNTVDAVERIVAFYRARGYEFTDPTGQPLPATVISRHYAYLGGAGAFLGSSRTAELPAPDGRGSYAHYQGGSIYWSADTGAHEVHGSIRAAWAAMRWEASVLGYPLTDETLSPDGLGRYIDFQGGRISWDSGSGQTTVSLRE